MSDWRVLGKRVPRKDALAKVTGQAVYADDMALPGMLHGAVVRSPHAHALVRSVDTVEAERLAGVKAVLTPDNCELLPREVRYAGQKIAVVAAEGRYTAGQAAELIDVRYEVLPAALDALTAMEPGAPQVWPSRTPGSNNIAAHIQRERGDVAAAFRRADVVVEDTYRVGPAHQAYMEPHCALARVEASGELTVWTSIQGQFSARAALARAINLPVHRVRVIAPEIGGAFGGKTRLTLEPVAAALAFACRRPVKVAMSRAEELTDSNPGPGCVVHIKTGALRDGTLVAEWAKICVDAGAGPGSPMNNFDRCLGLYRIPDFHYEMASVYTHKIVTGAYRAPGALGLTFAFESQIDALAAELGMDPIALRSLNAVQEGDTTIDGKCYPAIGLRETLRKAEPYVGGLQRRPDRGIGIACAKWINAVGASGVLLTVNEDGGICVTSGAVDLTGVNTVLAQIVAEELGVDVESVSVRTHGTHIAPYAAVSGGSRTTYGMGLATCRGAHELRRQMLSLAAENLGIRAEDLELSGGRVHPRGREEPCLSLAELAVLALGSDRGPLTATGSASSDTWLADHPAEVIWMNQIARLTVKRLDDREAWNFARCGHLGLGVDGDQFAGQLLAFPLTILIHVPPDGHIAADQSL